MTTQMMRRAQPDFTLLDRVSKLPYWPRLTALVNNVLVTTVGVRLSSARASVLDKEWFDTLLYFQRLFELIADVKGDVLECGVASGGSLGLLASLTRSERTRTHVWGFDSWSGLPPPSTQDAASRFAGAIEGSFASSLEKVRATLRWHGFTDQDIERDISLVSGDFAETLPRFTGSSIALLHVDADLYRSYQLCLDHLWGKVSVGGVVAFDEYHLSHDWPGAKQAVDEFLAQQPPHTVSLRQDPLFEHYYAVKLA